jgi:hypothetical protein
MTDFHPGSTGQQEHVKAIDSTDIGIMKWHQINSDYKHLLASQIQTYV